MANSAFLEANLAIRTLCEVVEIPARDILDQNARMFAGEDEPADIPTHARQWIEKNRSVVNQWLQVAGAAMKGASGKPGPASTANEERAKVKHVRVATKIFPPFVQYEHHHYTGFSIDLWEAIAREIGVTYDLYSVNSVAKMLDEVGRKAADVSIAGLAITSRRETSLDFSHPYFESGLQMLIEEPGQALRHTVLTQILGVLTSPQFTFVVVLLCVVLLLAGHVIWLIERRRNPDFPKSYVRGVGAGFWWAAVTITTVGYGDKTPRGSLGRSFAMLWMFAGYFVFAYFTASVTTTFTVQELHGTINRPEDLFGKQVGSVKRSAAADYLSRMGISFTSFANVEEAIAELEKGNLDAVVYAAPVLQHYAANQGKGRVRVVDLVFAAHDYGIALQASSPYREQINRALLKLMENGTYTTLYEKWFGS